MVNRYFSCVDMFRKHRKNIISRKIEYYKLDRYLKKVSPSYDDLKEMIQFVKLLEFSFLYPNEKGLIYTKVPEDMKCPVTVDAEMSKLVMNLFREGYTIKIVLSEEIGHKMITIEVINIKTKKARSTIRFEDGCYIADESIFEDHLFITIINDITMAIRQLLYIYCYCVM